MQLKLQLQQLRQGRQLQQQQQQRQHLSIHSEVSIHFCQAKVRSPNSPSQQYQSPDP